METPKLLQRIRNVFVKRKKKDKDTLTNDKQSDSIEKENKENISDCLE